MQRENLSKIIHRNKLASFQIKLTHYRASLMFDRYTIMWYNIALNAELEWFGFFIPLAKFGKWSRLR
jgi:hypothetical protein